MNHRITAALLALTMGLWTAPAHAEPVRDSRLLKKTSLKAGEVNFEDILKELSTRHKVLIEVDPGYVGIFQDDSLTIHQPVDGITFQSALSLLILGGDFVVDRGKVRIRSWEDLDENLVDVDHSLASLGPLAANSQQVADVIQICTDGLWTDIDGFGGEILGINARAVRIRQTLHTQYGITELLQRLPAAAQGRKPRGSAIDKANERVARSCTRVMTPAEETVTLSEALELLLAKNRIPYWLDLPELEASGIDPQAEVNLVNSKQSVGDHLTQILDSLELSAMIKHEVVFITPKEIAEESRISVAYNVSRHLSATVTVDDVYERLMQVDGTGPWEDIDGMGGIGSSLGPLLVIRHSRRAHQQIARILGTP